MTYREMLAVTQQHPEDADFHALRMAYTHSPEYAPYNHDQEQVHALSRALRANDLAAALETSLALLDWNYLDIEAHMAADYIYTSLGDESESAYHRAFARGLIAAILATGDGRGPDGAFIVISVPEEYTVLRVLGLKVVQQALTSIDGHWFDVVETEHRATGAAMQVYFNVDLPRGWLSTHTDPSAE